MRYLHAYERPPSPLRGMRFRHVGLYVGADLRAAEEYYATLFDMEVVVREGPAPSSFEWAQLPEDKGWDDAEAAGMPIGMVALQRGDVTLPLFAAEPSGDRFYAIGLVMSQEEIGAVRGRLGSDESVEDSRDDWLAFVDRYGTRWQLSDSAPFRGAGFS